AEFVPIRPPRTHCERTARLLGAAPRVHGPGAGDPSTPLRPQPVEQVRDDADVVRDNADLLPELELVAFRELDVRVLLVQLRDPRTARLEDEPVAAVRTGVGGKRLAAGVEQRESRFRAADDRRPD